MYGWGITEQRPRGARIKNCGECRTFGERFDQPILKRLQERVIGWVADEAGWCE